MRAGRALILLLATRARARARDVSERADAYTLTKRIAVIVLSYRDSMFTPKVRKLPWRASFGKAAFRVSGLLMTLD